MQEAARFWREHHTEMMLGKIGKKREEEEKKRVKRGEHGGVMLVTDTNRKAMGEQLKTEGTANQEGVIQGEIVDKNLVGMGDIFWSGHPQLGSERGRWELKGDPEPAKEEQLGQWMAEGHWDRETANGRGRMEQEEGLKQQKGQEGGELLKQEVLERNKSR